MSDEKNTAGKQAPQIDVNTLSLASCHDRTYAMASKYLQLSAIDQALKSYDKFSEEFTVAIETADLGAIVTLSQQLDTLDVALSQPALFESKLAAKA